MSSQEKANILAHHSSPQKAPRPTSKVVVPEGSRLLEPCAPPVPGVPLGTAWGQGSPCTPWLCPNPCNAIRDFLLCNPGGPDPKGGCRSHVAPKKDGGSLLWDGFLGFWRASCLRRRWLGGGLQRFCFVLPSSAPAVPYPWGRVCASWGAAASPRGLPSSAQRWGLQHPRRRFSPKPPQRGICPASSTSIPLLRDGDA